MSATDHDVELATGLANRIVAVSHGRVQSVAMIGSRALGTATPGSDLDLVVLVEVPAHVPPWRGLQESAERQRIQQQVGPAPIPTDLSVRTTDQYAEAADVLGGLEWLVKHQGRVVFSRPLLRPPRVRRSRAEVLRDHVSTWVDHAVAGVGGAARLASTVPRDSLALSRLAMERALNAVLVLHQVPARGKRLQVLLEQVREVEAHLASSLSPVLSEDRGHVSAGVFVGAVIDHLMGDAGLRASMTSLRRKLAGASREPHGSGQS